MILTILVAGTVTATAAPTAPAQPTARVPLQQVFDTASADAVAGKCRDAVTAFRSIEARAKGAGVLGAIRARMGGCLYRLQETEAARAALTDAIERLPKDETFRGDRFEALMTLGQIEYNALDYVPAVRLFTAALSIATTPEERFGPQLWIARTSMFDDPVTARSAAEDAIRIADATPSITKVRRGEIRSILGRVLLNQGKPHEAFAVLRKSVDEQGGLTTKVTFGDVIARSDLAIAALLSGKKDEAREYMAMTGAGRFEDTPFATARRIEPPPCDADAGLRPEDSAIVEFAIGASGAVVGVQPVWASRSGPTATLFARSVRNWSWAPADAAKIPGFFRAVTRVELRCSNNAERPTTFSILNAQLSEWVAAKGLKPAVTEGSDAQRMALLRAELARREAEGATADLIPILAALSLLPIAESKDVAMWAARAAELAKAARAPAPAWLALELRAMAAGQPRAFRPALVKLIDDPVLREDPVAAGVMRLQLANIDANGTSATTQLRAIVDDTRLAERHPVKIAALVRLADRQAREGDLIGARNSYTKTGLDDAQCALVGSAPDLKSYSGEFPQEAQKWGFEGWVRFETDVAADGRTTNQRAITVYPPFVFRDAAIQMARSMRFRKTYRPSGDAACSAYQSTVRFRIAS